MIKNKNNTSKEESWFQYYPKGKDVSLDYSNHPIYYFFDEMAEKHPRRTALDFYGYKVSYQELKNLSDRLAKKLQDLDIKKGDRVAFLLPNCPQIIIGILATMKAGAIPVPLNPLYPSEELLYVLKDFSPRFVISLKRFAGKLKGIDQQLNTQIILTNISDYLPSYLKSLSLIKEAPNYFARKRNEHNLNNFLSFVKLIEDSQSSDYQKRDGDLEKDTALMVYTSGTTGKPKGVMLTYSNLLSVVATSRKWTEGLKMDSFLGVLPFFHIYGLTTVLFFALYQGSTIYLQPQFHTKSALAAIKKNQIQAFVGVPAMYQGMLRTWENDKKKYDLSCLRVCTSGASSIPEETFIKIKEMAPQAVLLEGYGLSETSPIITMDPIRENYQKAPGSPGIPVFDTDIKVISLEEKERKFLDVGQIGEIIIKGPQVFKGYWQKPEKTKEVLKDGWFYTKDVGWISDDGRIYLKGRLDDMINSRGEKIWPAEVENILTNHPKVKEVAFVGVNSEYYGQTLKAFVVLEKNIKCTAKELIKYCQEKLIYYKIPREVEFVENLPKNIIGKIMRYKLRSTQK